MKNRLPLFIISIVFVVLALGAGGIYASDGAKPGDPTFVLDKAGESIMRYFKKGDDLVEFEMDVLDERLSELEELEEENIEEVDDALDEVYEQQKRVREREEVINEDNEDIGEEVREQIQERHEEQLEQMEQLQQQMEKKQANQFQDSVEEYGRGYRNGQ